MSAVLQEMNKPLQGLFQTNLLKIIGPELRNEFDLLHYKSGQSQVSVQASLKGASTAWPQAAASLVLAYTRHSERKLHCRCGPWHICSTTLLVRDFIAPNSIQLNVQAC